MNKTMKTQQQKGLITLSLNDITDTIIALSNLILQLLVSIFGDAQSWMASNKRLLNPSTSKFLLSDTTHHQLQTLMWPTLIQLLVDCPRCAWGFEVIFSSTYNWCGTWWHSGRVEAFRPEGCGFESRSSHHVGTLGKSLTRSCLWYFGVKLWHSIRAVSRELLSSSDLKRCYRNGLNELILCRWVT